MALDYTRLTWQQFEELCCDLLFREGYRDVQPVGRSGEQGADAVEYQARRGRGLCVWQFRRWTAEYSDNKLRESVAEEVVKLSGSGRQVRQFTIVWARDLGPSLRDQFTRGESIPGVGFEVRVLDADWLDRRLRVESQDLRRQYFGVPLEAHTLASLNAVCMHGTRAAVDRLIDEGKYIPELYVGRQIDQTVEGFLRSSGSSVLFVVDKAGSGKTCLACHSALSHSASSPILLIPGQSLFLQYPDDLVKHILSCLDYHDASNGIVLSARVDDLAGCLQQASRKLTVIIDAVNECVGLQTAREALLNLTGEAERLPMKVIVTCREAAWSAIASPVWSSRAYRLSGDREVPTVCHETGMIPRDAASRAFDAYFRHFGVKATLGPKARDALRHPLWLRLLCQARSGQDLGHIEDCREPEVLSAFWEDQVTRAAERAQVAQPAVQRVLLAVAQTMMDHLTPQADLASLESTTGLDAYSRNAANVSPLLACLQQNLLAEGAEGTVHFTPEILGEYAAGLSLLKTWQDSGFQAIEDTCRRLARNRRWWPVLSHLAALAPDASAIVEQLGADEPLAAASVAEHSKLLSPDAHQLLQDSLQGQLERPYRLDRERACVALARLHSAGHAERVRLLADAGLIRNRVKLESLGLLEDEDALGDILSFGTILLDLPRWGWHSVIQSFSSAYQGRLLTKTVEWAETGDRGRRREGILAMAFIGGEDCIGTLSAIARDGDAELLGPTAYALAIVGSPAALSALFAVAARCDELMAQAEAAASSDGGQERHAASQAVEQRTGFHFGTLWVPLVRTVSDAGLTEIARYTASESRRVRRLALQVLQHRTSLAAMRALVEAYDHWEARGWLPPTPIAGAWDALGPDPPCLSDDAAAYLRRVASRPESTAAGRLALRVLGRAHDAVSVPIFYGALSSQQKDDVVVATVALAECRETSSVAEIAQATRRTIGASHAAPDLIDWVAETATRALGKLGTEDAVQYIIELAPHCSTDATLWALGNMPTECAAEAIGQLVDPDDDWNVACAIPALIRTCTPTGLELASELIESASEETCDHVAFTMGGVGSHGSWWFPRRDLVEDGLLALWQGCSDEGRLWLVLLFRWVERDWARNFLIRVLRDSGGIPTDLARERESRIGLRYRLQAAEVLVDMGEPALLPAVVAAIDGGPGEARLAHDLGRFAPDLVAAELSKAIPHSADDRQQVMIDYLGYVGTEKHVALLEECMQSTEGLRDVAYEAIDRIRGRGLVSG